MTSRLLALAAIVVLLAGCATASKPAVDKASGREQSLIELRAVVASVDEQRRLLALERDDGAITVLPVAVDFRAFEKLRVGDPVVVVSYTEAIAWHVPSADKGAPGLTARETLSTAQPSEAPGGAMEGPIRILVFDLARGMVILSGPN